MEDIRSFSDRDLLSELIGSEAADRLYQGSLAKLLQKGIPDAELRPVFTARELWARVYFGELAQGPLLTAPEIIKDYLRMAYANKRYEVFTVLFLDPQNRLIAAEDMFRGTLTQTTVYVREVVVRALDHAASAVVFAHNHPSGSTEPSRADEAVTHTLKAALALVDVRVLDHFIVAGGKMCSLAEIGLI